MKLSPPCVCPTIQVALFGILIHAILFDLEEQSLACSVVEIMNAPNDDSMTRLS
jgi:hypothetical protein